MTSLKNSRGLFVGFVSLDLIYLASNAPQNNQKLTASEYTISAGGPATNAAVTFSYLGDSQRDSYSAYAHGFANASRATLLGVVGAHPIAQIVRTDLSDRGVTIFDLDPNRSEPPPISSIIVTEATGDRAVVSINATKFQITGDRLPPDPLQNIDIVLIDGHQMIVGQVIAQIAKSKNIPVVIDGGSWKPGFEEILPFVDYAICSANFYPPNCHYQQDVFAYLADIGIPHIAITRGEKPIQYLSGGTVGELSVPSVKTVDTLGAGDIFHGAFCYYILRENFTNALASSAKIAAHSCQFFGTRQWMERLAISY